MNTFYFKTQWHSETATITTWGDGIWSSTTSTGFTTQPVRYKLLI